MRKFLIPPLLLCLCACVDVPKDALPGAAAVPQPTELTDQGLDPGYKTEETAHFRVDAYGPEATVRYAALCEDNYTRIMQDLGLYSFAPARPYNVIIYKDLAELHAKVRLASGESLPDWSGGLAKGNSLLLVEGSGLNATMAHEMTHLIYADFMGLSAAARMTWLNEGLAVYEQTRADTVSAGIYNSRVNTTVAPNPIPFTQMVNLAPLDEHNMDVDRWYAQVGSVVGFMIRQGGSFNFSIFLTKLRSGADVDKALAETYGGMWSKLSDVEKVWKVEIQR